MMTFPRGTDSARVISVIETVAVRGSEKSIVDQCRPVVQYWDFEGNLLAENDPCKENNILSDSKVLGFVRQIDGIGTDFVDMSLLKRNITDLCRGTGYEFLERRSECT